MVSDIVVDNAANLSRALTALIEGESRRALATRPSFALALPGGSVARAFFPGLVDAALDWSRVDVFWGDERAVPPADPESNFGLAHSLLLGPARVPAERIHRMGADGPDLRAAASAYEGELLRVIGTPPQLDVALIGAGPDGHIASLFSGHPLLGEERRWVAEIADAPKPPPRRLTLTLPALASAHHVIVAALGDTKAEAIRESLKDPQSALPLALLLRRAPLVTVLLDAAAAGRLPG